MENRNDFMKFFRDDNKLNLLSVDDRQEIFKTVLMGSSDITKELIDEILNDYSVGNLNVIDNNKTFDIDCNVFSDNGISQHYFDESFIRSSEYFTDDELEENNLKDSFIYIDCGNLDLKECDTIYLKDCKIINITGYSQGDYARVLVPYKQLKKNWGSGNFTDKRYNSLKEKFTNLFYDSPIYIGLEINQEEFYPDEILNDWYKAKYEFDNGDLREKIITYVLEVVKKNYKDWDIEILKKELEGKIPLSVDYSCY